MFAVALALAPAYASAATFGAEVFGAFNTYSMSDWNDAIDDANQSGQDWDNLSSGLTGGLGLKMWANQNWMFSAGWEPLFTKTEDSSTPGSSISFDANSFQFTGAYFFPSQNTARYGIGAGVGYYSINGTAESTGSPDVNITGNTVGFHVMGMSEWHVNPSFAINAGAGYRIANVSETKAEQGGTEVTLTDSNGDNVSTDYSGFMGRVGFSFYLPSSTK
jgi:hypothetical protein